MIRFSCDGCGKTFAVPDEYVGRKARCKGCGAMMVVPALAEGGGAPENPAVAIGQMEKISITSTSPADHSVSPVTGNPPDIAIGTKHNPGSTDQATAPLAGGDRLPVRMRRLVAEARQVTETFAASQVITVTPEPGPAPEKYAVLYRLKGLEKTGPSPSVREEHRIEIELGADYPRMKPQCRILTPIFHPNFDATTICVGDHWTAGERLVDLIIRIGEMIAFQDYNIKSPLNGEAAMWTDLNRKSLPIDPRPVAPLAAR